MANPQLIEYLQRAFQQHLPDDQIRSALVKSGWSEFDIGLAWQAAKEPTQAATPKKKRRHTMSASETLLFIGGLIIIVAAATLIGSSWSSLNPVARIFAVLIPNVILVVAGAIFWRNEQTRHAAYAFLVTGSLVMPITIGTIIWQATEQSTIGNDVRIFFTALMSLAGYGYILLRYRGLIWSTLSTMAVVFAYAAFLSIIHIEKIFAVNPWAWSFALFGAGLYAVGLAIERRGWKYYARSPYFFGALSLLISLATLGLTGNLFGEAWLQGSSRLSGQQTITTLIIGLIFLALGGLMAHLRKQELVEVGRLKPLWDFMGTLAVTGSFLLVSDKNITLIFSFITVVLSLGFLYLAVRLQVRPYFQAAAMILAVDLLKIGFENFSNTLGWPVVLMFFGLVFMGGGYALTRLQKKLFVKAAPETVTTGTGAPPSPISG